VRARNRLNRIIGTLPNSDYSTWREPREPVWAAEVAELEARLRSAGELPAVTVLILGDGEAAQATAGSVHDQGYPNLRVTRASGPMLAPQTGPGAGWLVALRAGDKLAAGALWRIAAAVRENPGAAVVYGDHDLVDASGLRRLPQFKPGWNQPYFVAWNYIGRAAASISPRWRANTRRRLLASRRGRRRRSCGWPASVPLSFACRGSSCTSRPQALGATTHGNGLTFTRARSRAPLRPLRI
jgi:hypothetical protein